MQDFLLGYVMCPSQEVANQLAYVAVSERLAACVNILPGLTSIYLWQEQIEQTSEILLLAKVPVGLWKQFAQRLKDIHPYECPAIIALPIQSALPAFKDWVCSTATG